MWALMQSQFSWPKVILIVYFEVSNLPTEVRETVMNCIKFERCLSISGRPCQYLIYSQGRQQYNKRLKGRLTEYQFSRVEEIWSYPIGPWNFDHTVRKKTRECTSILLFVQAACSHGDPIFDYCSNYDCLKVQVLNRSEQANASPNHRCRLCLPCFSPCSFLDTAQALTREVGPSITRYEVCDNIDLPTILQVSDHTHAPIFKFVTQLTKAMFMSPFPSPSSPLPSSPLPFPPLPSPPSHTGV